MHGARTPGPVHYFLHELGKSLKPDPVEHSMLFWISSSTFQTWVPEILISFWGGAAFQSLGNHAISNCQAEISHKPKIFESFM